jgi:hypothetical protein
MDVKKQTVKEASEMELENLSARRAANEEALVLVASKIRPLPQEVEPSPEFRARTRLQLLKLPRPQQSSQRQAA